MPNPFPGMDPYLEGDLWTTVHTDLCAEIARQLAPNCGRSMWPSARGGSFWLLPTRPKD